MYKKTKYVELIEKHGSLEEFSSVLEDAFDDGFCTWEEKESARKEYELELLAASKEEKNEIK